MIVANFLASRHQYRNAFAVTRLQLVIAIHIHHFEVKMMPRLQFSQGGNHVLAKMAILPAVYNSARETSVSGAAGLLAVATIHFHGDERSWYRHA